MGITSTLCACLLVLPLLAQSIHNYNSGVMRCHDCFGKECMKLIRNGWSGKCLSRESKCFIRQDPNGHLYRGCADHHNWPPMLDMSYNGCRYQKYGMWQKTKVKWCFCDFDFCNVNETYITTRGGKLSFQAPQVVHNKHYSPVQKRPQPKPRPYSNVNSANPKVVFPYQGRVEGRQAPPTKRNYQSNIKYVFKTPNGQIYSSRNQNKHSRTNYYARRPKTLPAIGDGGRPPQKAPVLYIQNVRPYPFGFTENRGPINGNLRMNNGNHGMNNGNQGMNNGNQGMNSVPRAFNHGNQGINDGNHARAISKPPIDYVSIARSIGEDGPKHNQPAAHIKYQPRQPIVDEVKPNQDSPNKQNDMVSSGIMYMVDQGKVQIVTGPPPRPAPTRAAPAPRWVFPAAGRELRGKPFSTAPPVVVTPPAGRGRPYDTLNGALSKSKIPTFEDLVMVGRRPRLSDLYDNRVSPILHFTTTESPPEPQPEPENDQKGQEDKLVGIKGKEADIQELDDTSYDEEFWDNVPLSPSDAQHLLPDLFQTSKDNPRTSAPWTKPQKPRPTFTEETRNHVEYGSCDEVHCEHVCDVEGGVPVCSCNKGFRLADDKKRCLDENECENNNGGCSHKCRNKIGSYTCHCPKGFILDSDQLTCIDYNECKHLDEVQCEQRCVNTAGSYECGCNNGYNLNTDKKTCDDVDECLLGFHDCDHICINTGGSFQCACHHGSYLAADRKACHDENECMVRNGECQQKCINMAGGFRCDCAMGYALNIDSRTCDDEDECETNNGGCLQRCVNNQGSYMCECEVGYQLDADQRKCIDINECKEDNGECDHSCQNVPGSFSCSCRSGYQLNVDSKSCDSQDACDVDNGGCAHVCTTTQHGPRCSCNQGYQLDTDSRSCKDINECQSSNGGCNQQCTNTLGSFLCSCRRGYALNVDARTCDDDDECRVGNGRCEQICENTVGSYSCDCSPGFSLGANKRSCQDINECMNNNGGCEQSCLNTVGSYYCNCSDDLLFLASDGRSCIADCPRDFIKVPSLSSCYKVFSENSEARSVNDSAKHCKDMHPKAKLVSIESDDERKFIKDILSQQEPDDMKVAAMLEGWQGWWTSGTYHSGINQFQWDNGIAIENHWGFKKSKYEETCVWILQISVYNYTYGNYDCNTETGHICEINLPTKIAGANN